MHPAGQGERGVGTTYESSVIYFEQCKLIRKRLFNCLHFFPQLELLCTWHATKRGLRRAGHMERGDSTLSKCKMRCFIGGSLGTQNGHRCWHNLVICLRIARGYTRGIHGVSKGYGVYTWYIHIYGVCSPYRQLASSFIS